jgi:hypothetical protein
VTTPKLPEGLEPVAWTEKHTMAAIRATASFGTVELTREHGPYDINRPSFKCDRLVEAIVAARDVHWQAALQALAAEIAALREDAARYRWLRDKWDAEPASAEFYPCIRLYNLAGDADEAFCGQTNIDAAIDAARAAADQGGAS